MKSVLLALATLSLALPNAAFADNVRVYHGHTYYKHCRHSSGTTGLVAGGVGGAIAGGSLIGGGLAGPIIGGVAGAFGGRAIDRTITAKRRCGWYRH
ncbi:MAG: hypothetical protein KGK11_02690 [Sphingomonadales bacterium]|nr:hypothetical protein [Sphingomonadales bacterium]